MKNTKMQGQFFDVFLYLPQNLKQTVNCEHEIFRTATFPPHQIPKNWQSIVKSSPRASPQPLKAHFASRHGSIRANT